MQYLSIKNFETFQHYRTRRPPWIKLYQTLLEDYAFTRLSDTSKWHLVGLFLLASRYDNKVPYDLPWITAETKSTSPIDIDELVIAGFVTVCDARAPLAARKHRASKTLEPRKQNAMIERETERETEKEPLPAPVVAGGPVLVADPPPRAAAKPRPPAKYPHFPPAVCDRLHAAWGKLGAPDYGHFRKEFARLYTRPEPDYPVEDLEAAIRDAILLAQAEGGYALRSLTPKSFVDRAAHWVAYGKMPLVDPRTGWLSEKGDRLTRPA